MPLRTHATLTLALVGAITTTSVQAQACPEPTLELCRDTAWLETGCGQEAMTGGCFELLADGAMNDGHLFPEAMRLGLEGELEPVRLSAYDPSGYSHEIEGAGSWSDQIAMTAARSTALGEFDPHAADLRHIWEQNGSGLSTCEEYVYEKYFAVSQLDDAIATLQHDPAGALALAREATFIAEIGPDPLDDGPVLLGYDGDPIPGEEERELQFVARNPFLSTPEAVVAAHPELADMVLSAEPRPATLGWQMWAAEQLEGVPVELLEERGQAADRYAADLAERARLVAEIDAEHAGEEPDGEYIEGLMVQVAGLDESLVAQLYEANALGCLEQAEVGPCDWHPGRVVEAVTDRHAEAREADYQACKVIERDVGGDLTVLRDRPILDLYEAELFPGRDWLDAYRTFDIYRALLEAAKAERERQAQAEADAEARRIAKARAALTAADGSVKNPEKRHHKYSRLGDSNFNLYYEYLMRWRVFGFERILCNVNAEFEAMFRTGATVFGKSFDVLYARLFANLHRYEGDLRIAGQSLYRDHRNLVGQLHFDLVKPTDRKKTFKASASAWFTVIFVPVKVEGGISGGVGLKYRAKAGVDKGGSSCTHVAAYIEGRVEPYARLDAFAAVAIELLVARGGIKGRIELLTVSVPFLARIELNAPQGDIRALELVVRSKLDMALSALSGAISLWGELGWCPFCIKGETVIFKWKGPRWNHNLFDVRLAFPLDGLKRIREGA